MKKYLLTVIGALLIMGAIFSLWSAVSNNPAPVDGITQMQDNDATKPEAAIESMSVKYYGAKGDGSSNDTVAFLKALESVGKNGTIYIPKGTYIVDPDSLIVPEGAKLVGENYTSSIIQSSSSSKSGFGLKTSKASQVSNLYISGFGSGIHNAAYWTKIYDNKLYGNEVGIYFDTESFIVKCLNNDITFNDIGILVGEDAEAYQLVIANNVIDNNNGLGIGIKGLSGVVIENNTIEGNRSRETGNGCGLLIGSSNMSRAKISGNWFENNGDSEYAVDLLMVGGDMTKLGLEVIDSVKQSLPPSYRSYFDRSDNSPLMGSVAINENYFAFTQYSCILSGSKASITVQGNAFKGELDKYNKHIFLNMTNSAEVSVDIDNNHYRNSDNPLIDDQVESGIDGTIVHSEAPLDLEIYYNKSPL